MLGSDNTAGSMLNRHVHCKLQTMKTECRCKAFHVWQLREPSLPSSFQGGNFPVVSKDHTVVCNWNELTVPLLRQIAVAKSRRRKAYMGGCVLRSHSCIHL